MNFSGLLAHITGQPQFRELVKAVQEPSPAPDRSAAWEGVVPDAAKPCLIAALHLSLDRPIVVITARPETAKDLHEQLEEWVSPRGHIFRFPEPDVLPYERQSWEPSISLDRLKVLHLLTQGWKSAPVLIASLPALFIKTPSRDYFSGSCQVIKAGMQVAPLDLLRGWSRLGYEAERAVEVPGTFSRRGGIIDVYSPAEEYPTRLELFGNQVESLRKFDPNNQCSIGTIDSALIIPARESLVEGADGAAASTVIEGLELADCRPEVKSRLEKEIEDFICGEPFEGREYYAHLFQRGTLFDYLPRDALLVFDDANDLRSAYQELDDQAEQLREQQVAKGELPRSFPKPYLAWQEITERIERISSVVRLEKWDKEGSSSARFSSFAPRRQLWRIS